MAQKVIGTRTVQFANPPSLTGFACVVGKKEGEGPLVNSFDYVAEDTTFGETTWEKSESRMQKDAFGRAVTKSGVAERDINYIFAGDLMNQCIASSYASRGKLIPFIGLYGACSTMSESLMLAAMTVDGGYADHAAAVTSSHFCSAERQYRFPLEYGGQRTPTAQWTVTGAGAVIVSAAGQGPYVTHVTPGSVIDFGIKDINSMGSAMAPAVNNNTPWTGKMADAD